MPPDGGVDYLFTCPQGPDPLTSSSQLISSRWFNINPEGQDEPQSPRSPTLWRTLEGYGHLAAWPWSPCLALCTASMVRGSWKLGQAGELADGPVGWGLLAPRRTQSQPPGRPRPGIQLRGGVTRGPGRMVTASLWQHGERAGGDPGRRGQASSGHCPTPLLRQCSWPLSKHCRCSSGSAVPTAALWRSCARATWSGSAWRSSAAVRRPSRPWSLPPPQ